MKDFFKPKYRIEKDTYLGYEALIKYWWWPFWINFNCNTCSSYEEAKARIVFHESNRKGFKL